MKLIIVESSNKVKKIEKFFVEAGENDIKVVVSFGHIADLPERGLGLDEHLRPQYNLTTSGKKTVAYLRKLVKGAKEVYLATDPDREGEATAFHLQRELKIHSPKRISFAEITPKAVIAAYRHPRTLDKALYQAQETRRVLDRLVG
ncbi:toprim domain-containing protein [uncultured Microbulbifer sp.]|uniref:toprim domain-containing protein n=1 Tax=uncultured Microbulbifer sp. TaxID=348147 RepID=UPI0026274174|nr:toprim domain-containing protein [uncultured Microbulbifer sp.]